MGRPVYPHELTDPDFSWLLTSFQENNPGYLLVDMPSLPLILIREFEEDQPAAGVPGNLTSQPEIGKAK